MTERKPEGPGEHEDDPVRLVAQMMRELGPVSFEGFTPSDFLRRGVRPEEIMAAATQRGDPDAHDQGMLDIVKARRRRSRTASSPGPSPVADQRHGPA
jgi:hypothetical protein